MPDHVCDFADIKDSKSVQGIVRSSKLPAMQLLPGRFRPLLLRYLADSPPALECD